MPNPKPTLDGPLTGTLDLRSQPDQLTAGTVRFRQNLQTTGQGKLRRGTGFEKFLNGPNYNNSDFHDQLVGISGQPRSPVTLLFEAESTREVRSLIIASQSVVAQLDQHNGSYRILGSGFGGNATQSATAPRFKAARQGDFVLLTNNFDKVQFAVLEQPPDPSGNYLSTLDDLETIGLSKAAVIWSWRNVVFLANVVMDGTRFGYRLLWSDFDHPTGFDPADVQSITGSKDLFTHETILAGAPAGNSFLIYTTHGIWEMVAVGGDQSFDFRRVYNGESKDGSDTVKAVLAYSNTLCNVHDEHMYVGHDGIYVFNQYYSAPSRPEWLHRASADLFNLLDTSVCEPHVAAAFGDEVYFSIASAAAANHCPDYTLRANRTYQVCDTVDHGFLTFCQFSPQDIPTIRDFIVENEICTLTGLAAQGYPYGNENLPRPLPSGDAPFTPDSMYSSVRLAIDVRLADGTIDTVHVENYTQPNASSTSLCAVLNGVGINDICKECRSVPLFVAVSSVDWCLKQLGRVFYREMCLNATAVGGTDINGYTASIGSYELDAITSLIRFAPIVGNDELVKCQGLQLDYVPVAQNPASQVSLRVGVSAQPSDPNTGIGMRWFQHSSKDLAYVSQKNQAQHEAAGTQPSQPLKWRFEREARMLYLELTINGIGGDSTFSRIAADIGSGGRTTNY